jgi:hypothetical protein
MMPRSISGLCERGASEQRQVNLRSHVWSLHELQESQIQDMRCRSQIKDGRIPRNERNAPYSSQAEYALGVVEKAVYARVGQVA